MIRACSLLAGVVAMLAFTGCEAAFWKDGLQDNPVVAGPVVAPPSQGPEALQLLDPGTSVVSPAPPQAAPPTANSPVITFRRVEAGSGLRGVPPQEKGWRPDDTWTTYTVARYWLAVTETTRTQWTALANAAGLSGDANLRPWLLADPLATAGGADGAGDLPATHVSLALIETMLGAWNRARPTTRLRLPTAIEWEHACRARSAGPYSFPGNDPQAARPYAVVRETRATNGLQAAAGTRTSNALGFWDMHGNAWEYVQSGNPAILRGGSWQDNLISARSGNHQEVDRGQPHALAGVRLVLDLP
jgi:sulfatase modifying factor 1